MNEARTEPRRRWGHVSRSTEAFTRAYAFSGREAGVQAIVGDPLGPRPAQRWAVLGEMSSGKSTLLNQLFAQQVLREDAQGSTTAPVHIARPTAEYSHGVVILEPRTEEQQRSILEWLLPAELKQALLESTPSEVSAEWAEQFGTTTPYGVATLVRQLFALLVAEEGKRPPPVIDELGCLDSALLPLDPLVWQRAIVFLDTHWAELGVEWIDLPGLGHANPLHRWMTEQVLATADRSFLLVEPRGATETTLDLLAALDPRVRASMSLVFSRIDETAGHGEDWRAASEKVVEQIGWDGPWVALSALCARAARNALQICPGQRELRNLERVALQHEPLSPVDNLKLSGMPAFEAMLRDWALEYDRKALRSHVTDLDAAVRDLERQIERNRDARRAEAIGRFREVLGATGQEIRSREGAATASLRRYLQETVAAERTAFARLDVNLRSSERRQSAWLRLLTWNVKYKAALAGALRGLGGPLAGALRVIANALMVPHGAGSARSQEHARDLVNIRRVTGALGPVDQLTQGDFLAEREQRLAGLSPLARWSTRLGFAGRLRREALGYVAEMAHARAVDERDLIRKDLADSGLGRWRTPLRRDLAARRRMSSLLLARSVEQQAVPAVRQLAATARDGLDSLGRAGSDIVAALDSDADHQLVEELSALRTSLCRAKMMLNEDES